MNGSGVDHITPIKGNMNVTSNNASSTPTTDTELPLFAKITVALQIIIMCVVVFGNVLVLTAILNFRVLQDVTGVFVANLAIADLITGISLPFQITFFYFPEMEKNKFACLLRFEIISFVCNASSFSLLCTVVDRYISIAYPLRYVQLMTTRKACIMVACIWIGNLLFSLIPIFGANNWEVAPFCLYELVMNKYFRMANSCVGLFLAAFMMLIYAKILFIIRKHVRQIQSVTVEQPTNVYSEASFIRTQQMNTIIAIVVIMFHISWLPFLCIELTMLDFESVTQRKVMVANFLVFLGIMNSMVNPVIYAWKNKRYRRAFKKLLRLGDADDTMNTSRS